MNGNEPFKSINNFLNKILLEDKKIISKDTIFRHEEERSTNRNRKIVVAVTFFVVFLVYIIFYVRMLLLKATLRTVLVGAVFIGINFLLGFFYFVKKKKKSSNLLASFSLFVASIYLGICAFEVMFEISRIDLGTKLGTTFYSIRNNPAMTDAEFESLTNAYYEAGIEYTQLSQFYYISSQMAIYTNVVAFMIYSELSILMCAYSMVFSIFVTVIGNENFETHRSYASVYDSVVLIVVHTIQVSIKYLHNNLVSTTLAEKANLMKIKQFYHNWLHKLNICYTLVNEGKVVFKNSHFQGMLRKYYGIPDADRFFKEAKIVESYCDEFSKEDTLSDCLPVFKCNSEFRRIALFSLLVDQNGSKTEFFFECMVKSYSFEYTEMLFSDMTELICSQKASYEEKYKNMLFAKIAHEFKTPILAIIELADRMTTQTENLADLRIVSNLSHYVLYLISDVTSYVHSKVQCEMLKQKCQIGDIGEFCFNILEVLLTVNENKKANIKCSFKNELPKDEQLVWTDEVRIKQILLNFLSNAVKFTISGFIRIRIFREEQNICVSVADSGRGMSEDQLNSLKTQDMQFVVRDEYNQMGSGLGLSIVYNLAAQLKCEIQSKSTVGKGTCFTLLIPSETEECKDISLSSQETEMIMPMLRRPSALFDSPLLKRMSFEKEELIILADDNALIRNTLSKLIHKLAEECSKKWKIVQCSDGVFALSETVNAIQQGKKIVCVVLDEYMDFFSGSFTASLFDSMLIENKINEFPIISCSAFDSPSYKQKIFDSGVSAIIEKPASFKILRDVFNSLTII